MPFKPFQELFPELARTETRLLTIMSGSKFGLPPGAYGFFEMYCDEENCDCRRVMFTIASPSSKETLAVVAWGWEARDFYERWLKMDDPKMVKDLQGPILNFGSPQTSLAPALLKLVEDVLLQDPAYVERIKRHYHMFRETIDARKNRRRGSVTANSRILKKLPKDPQNWLKRRNRRRAK